jgi:hypothetical protein
MKEVTVLFSNIVDVNIFHFFALEVHAVWETIYNHAETKYIVFLKDYKDNGVHRWRIDLLNSIVPTFHDIEQLQTYCKNNTIFIKHINNLTYQGWVIDPWSFIDYQPSSKFMKLADTVKENMHIPKLPGKYATLVTRTKSRVLYDNTSKINFNQYFAEYCKQKEIPHKIVCFDDISLEQQAIALADTKVMLSCHGAGNTNVFLLPDNGHLMEINFRKHWYCDPVCKEHFEAELPTTCRCNGKLTWRPYFHKADYHNMSKFFGKKYTELELEYVEGFIDSNPINVRNVYIDSKYIMESVMAAMAE